MSQTIPLKNTQAFSKTFLDYIAGDLKLKPFYGLSPEINNFAEQLKAKDFSEEKRKILHTVLNEQYKGFVISDSLTKNVNALLKSSTYTVTTGHQLNLFGGPLYFIYKIVTTINTAKQLNEQYKEQHFVPVFWMASEDHDFEEINHFNLFGKSWKWETSQKGAVGRFSLEGMDELLNILPEKIELFRKAYCEHKSLAASTRFFVNELFGEDGLVVIDADNTSLKKQFSVIIKDEILHHSSQDKVLKTSALLEQLNYEAQVHSREINLFYLENGFRERIIPEGLGYKVNNTELVFSKEEILLKIDNEPEKFSPNVILRPVYQECILPNLAYIGGPAEVVYWLQLKEVFEHFKIPFPILMPRNFALYLNKGNDSKLAKLKLKAEEFFVSEEQLKNNYLQKIAEEDFKLIEETKAIENIFSGIKEKVGLIDKTMEAAVLAEFHKVVKILEDLEKRLKKAEERKNEVVLTQLINLKGKLFPGGGLQERSDNFLSFYLNDPEFITKIKKAFNPFQYSFYILSENE